MQRKLWLKMRKNKKKKMKKKKIQKEKTLRKRVRAKIRCKEVKVAIFYF